MMYKLKDILLATTNKDKIKELIPVLETKFHLNAGWNGSVFFK